LYEYAVIGNKFYSNVLKKLKLCVYVGAKKRTKRINAHCHISCGNSPAGGDVDLRIRRDVLAENFLPLRIT
jgi:hypothetical protein